MVEAECAYVHTSTDEMLACSSPRYPFISHLATSKHPLVYRVDRIHVCTYIHISSWPVPCIRPLPPPCPMWGGPYPTPPVALPHPPRNWLLAAATSRAALDQQLPPPASTYLGPAPDALPGRAMWTNPRETGGCIERSPRDPSSAIYIHAPSDRPRATI